MDRFLLKAMANQAPKAQISPKANRQKSEKGFLPKAAKETKVLVWICYELRMKQESATRKRDGFLV